MTYIKHEKQFERSLVCLSIMQFENSALKIDCLHKKIRVTKYKCDKSTVIKNLY